LNTNAAFQPLTTTTVQFGAPFNIGWAPLVGNWSGAGDSIGNYDPASSTYFLRDTNTPGPADHTVGFGPAGAGWKPVKGHFVGAGPDTVGLYDPIGSSFFLKYSLSSGPADRIVSYGPGSAGWTPLMGNYN